jgi:hypothetical protein
MLHFLKQNWGNLASVVGLVVSLAVLWVAKKAKDAAEGARSLARLKSLLEELESAGNRVQSIRAHLKDRKWDLVDLLVDQALSACRSALKRWADHLAESSRDNLVAACRLLRSILETCVKASTGEPSDEQWRLAMNAQQEARELMSTALGQVKGAEERSGRPNG